VIRIITIDREYGCGVADIARELAARTGWKLWDLLLMFWLGIFSAKVSPPEQPSPNFIIVTNEMAASGTNASGRRTAYDGITKTLTLPVVQPSIMLDVGFTTQNTVTLPKSQVRVMQAADVGQR
jgi:hypothetical protein